MLLLSFESDFYYSGVFGSRFVLNGTKVVSRLDFIDYASKLDSELFRWMFGDTRLSLFSCSSESVLRGMNLYRA